MTGNENANEIMGMGGNGMVKVIPAHLYSKSQSTSHRMSLFTGTPC